MTAPILAFIGQWLSAIATIGCLSVFAARITFFIAFIYNPLTAFINTPIDTLSHFNKFQYLVHN